MIQLPQDFLSKAYIDPNLRVIMLFFKNSADQYFYYRFGLDRALSLQEQLDKLQATDFSMMKAYQMGDKLEVEFVDPADQNWKVVPLPGDPIMSLEQYRALERMRDEEQRRDA